MANLKNPDNCKVVGIMGGMGPYATLMFMQNLLDLTNAGNDWDHIRTVCDNNTHVPSRSRALLYNEESPLPAMLDSCRKLQSYPVDIIVIPCNSACYWYGQLQREIRTPIINIVSVAAEALLANQTLSRVAVLGGMVTYQTDLYKKDVERLGAQYLRPSEAIQRKVVELIERIKLDGTAAGLDDSMTEVIRHLAREQRVERIVLACTEFTQFRNLVVDNVRLVDSSSALAQMVVDYAIHGRSLPIDVRNIEEFWRQRAALLESGELGVLQSTMLTASEAEAAERDELEKATLLRILKPLLRQDGMMLELGCGHGRWSRTLCQYVNHIDAYDYSADLISRALELSQEAKNVSFNCAPVETLAPVKQYDYVVSIALLHYLSDEQFNKTIELVRNSTKPGGLAVFRESFGCDSRFELHGFYSSVLHSEYHAVYRTAEELIGRMGSEFACIHVDTSLRSTADKPETCQKIVIFRKTC